MFRIWFATLAFILAAGAAHAQSCDAKVARFDTYLKKHPNATGDLRQTVGAQLMHQPTRDAVEKAKKEAHQHLLDLLAKAKEEQAAHDEPACQATLKEVDWMMHP